MILRTLLVILYRQKREARDSSLQAANNLEKDWEQKTKDCIHWLNEYLNLSAIMLSSVSARKQSQLITITTSKNGCDSSILSAGFSAQTAGRCVSIKRTVTGAKYEQIIEDSLLRSAKHLRLVQRLMFCSNNDLKHTAQWDQYWNGCRTKVRKTLKCLKSCDIKLNFLFVNSAYPT